MRTIEDKAFLFLIVAVSLVFLWIVRPFYGALLWGTVTAILFAPLFRRLTNAMGQRRNLAALITVIIIVTIVILPLTLVGVSLVQEVSGVYRRVQTGELDLVRFFQHILDALPAWATHLLDRFGLVNLGVMQERLSTSLMKGMEFFAGQAFSIGQGTFGLIANLLVMLYLLFFLLRDEAALATRLKGVIPLRAEQLQGLLLKFTVVIRATIKGDLFVALLQGALGGLIFWILGVGAPLLWAVVMALVALLPVVGAGLIWGPVALYFLVTGAMWQGLGLIAYGMLAIVVIDNYLRPLLIGNDTKMPNYVVLISTLGGIATFGLNGLVIGPVIAAMFIAAWDIFSASRREARSDDTRP